MSPQTHKELREEFDKQWSKSFIKAGGLYWPHRDSIADWWLSKMEEREQQIIEKIKGTLIDANHSEEYLAGFFNAKRHFLSLFTPNTPTP